MPPPESTPVAPDDATRKSPAFTSGDADNQVFHFQRFGLSYGTDDKGHAAALILSALLLGCAVVIAIIGAFALFSGKDPQWLQVLITWIGNGFLFTAGIAVGKGKASDKSDS